MFKVYDEYGEPVDNVEIKINDKTYYGDGTINAKLDYGENRVTIEADGYETIGPFKMTRADTSNAMINITIGALLFAAIFIIRKKVKGIQNNKK